MKTAFALRYLEFNGINLDVALTELGACTGEHVPDRHAGHRSLLGERCGEWLDGIDKEAARFRAAWNDTTHLHSRDTARRGKDCIGIEVYG